MSINEEFINRQYDVTVLGPSQHPTGTLGTLSYRDVVAKRVEWYQRYRVYYVELTRKGEKSCRLQCF